MHMPPRHDRTGGAIAGTLAALLLLAAAATAAALPPTGGAAPSASRRLPPPRGLLPRVFKAEDQTRSALIAARRSAAATTRAGSALAPAAVPQLQAVPTTRSGSTAGQQPGGYGGLGGYGGGYYGGPGGYGYGGGPVIHAYSMVLYMAQHGLGGLNPGTLEAPAASAAAPPSTFDLPSQLAATAATAGGAANGLSASARRGALPAAATQSAVGTAAPLARFASNAQPIGRNFGSGVPPRLEVAPRATSFNGGSAQLPLLTALIQEVSSAQQRQQAAGRTGQQRAAPAGAVAAAAPAALGGQQQTVPRQWLAWFADQALQWLQGTERAWTRLFAPLQPQQPQQP